MEGVFACVGRIVNYPQITQILLFVSVNLLSYETRSRRSRPTNWLGPVSKRVERPAQGAFYDNHALVSLGYWRNLGRVVVGNQPPAPLLLHPHPGKASVTGNSLAFVLPIHC